VYLNVTILACKRQLAETSSRISLLGMFVVSLSMHTFMHYMLYTHFPNLLPYKGVITLIKELEEQTYIYKYRTRDIDLRSLGELCI
jgi:hypothetical protein